MENERLKILLQFLNWKLSSVGMDQSAEQYLVYHKFGAVSVLIVSHNQFRITM